MDWPGHRRLLARLACLVACGLWLVAAPSGALAQGGHRVLMLYSYHDDLPWQRLLRRGLLNELSQLTPAMRPVLFDERIDVARLDKKAATEALENYLAHKYASAAIDTVVAESFDAADFLRNRPQLFPGARRYYVNHGIADWTPSDGVGVRLNMKYDASLGIIPKVVPSLNRLVVVTDRSAPQTQIMIKIHPVLDELRKKMTVEIWDDYSFSDLFQRARGLGANSAIYYIPVFADNSGARVSPFETARRLAEAAPVPVFVSFDSVIGSGVVGGYVESAERLGRLIVGILVNGLRDADAAAELADQVFGTVFDYPPFERFGLNASGLPADTRMLNQPVTLWQAYRWHIIVAVSVVAIQAVLIAALLATVRSRNQAYGALEIERQRVAEHARDLTAANTQLEALARELTRHQGHLEELVRERTAALEVALKQAAAANRAKSAFLATMSHEIRTPMNAVIGLGNLVLNTELSPQQHDYLTKMMTAADGLLRLLNDILDLSKIEVGKLLLAATTFAFRLSLKEVLSLMECQAEAKGLKLVAAIDLLIPEYLVGDFMRLRQILFNLLGNAVKFTQSGEVHLGVRLAASEDEGVPLEFTIRDTGIGMTREQLGSIFEPFTQAESSTARIYGGTGLGLSICRQLVDLMGGTITAASQLGQGSTFTFTILLQRGNGADLPLREAPPGNPLPVLRGRRILVAEDQPLNQQVIREILEQMGMVVTLVGDGEEAVLAVAGSGAGYDAVLMDIRMPVMDGYEATRRIRQLPGCQKLPIIALTADVMSEERFSDLTAGMVAVLAKPIDVNRLRQALIRWILPSPEGDAALFVPENVMAAEGHIHPWRGFDLPVALQRLGGNGSLYLTLLRGFVGSQSGVVDEIRTALTTGETAVALNLAHRLRGLSGNLAAGDVATAAGAVEELLNSSDTAGMDELLMELERVLTEALGEASLLPGFFETVVREQLVVGHSVDVAAVTPLLNRLHELLMKNSMQARIEVAPVSELLQGTPLGSKGGELAAALTKFNYRAARSIVDELAASLEIVLS